MYVAQTSPNPKRVPPQRVCSGHMGNRNSLADRLQFWMPWKERNTMSERVGLINGYLSGDFGVSELSVEYEVSRKTIYKWIGRYESEGWEGLKDLSRAPLRHPNSARDRSFSPS